LEIFLVWRAVAGRPDMAKASGWTLRVVEAYGEPLGSFDMCHHPGAG